MKKIKSKSVYMSRLQRDWVIFENRKDAVYFKSTERNCKYCKYNIDGCMSRCDGIEYICDPNDYLNIKVKNNKIYKITTTEIDI